MAFYRPSLKSKVPTVDGYRDQEIGIMNIQHKNSLLVLFAIDTSFLIPIFYILIL